jgi:hypothetical protein
LVQIGCFAIDEIVVLWGVPGKSEFCDLQIYFRMLQHLAYLAELSVHLLKN